MGWAKFQEDVESRRANDSHAPNSSQTPGRCTPQNPPLKVEGEKKMSQLKDFTRVEARKLPVVLLADVSGSMGVDGKIQALNLAVREMLEAFREESELRAEIHVAVITFGGAAKVHVPLSAAKSVEWIDANAAGGTPMGQAFRLATQLVEDRAQLPSRSYRPTIVLVSDGVPTDEWTANLQELLGSERASKAFRMALAIGADADNHVLRAFLADAQSRVFQADEARQIRQFFKLVTMSVSSRSRSATPNEAAAVLPVDGWDL